MAGILTHRPAQQDDASDILNLLEDNYGKRPAEDLLPEDRLVIEEDGKIVGFAALYRLDDVVIGAVDWAAIEAGRSSGDIKEILAEMVKGLRDLKAQYELHAIMFNTPYDEARDLLGEPGVKPGEQKIRRLVVSNA